MSKPAPGSHRVTLGQLRAIKLPTKPTDAESVEPDHITAIRNALEAHEGLPDSHKLLVPSIIDDLIPEDPPAVESPKADPNAKLKS